MPNEKLKGLELVIMMILYVETQDFASLLKTWRCKMAKKKTTKVKSVPKGMHTLTPHIICKGAADAIRFYKRAFGAVEISKMPTPDKEKLLHAAIRIGDSVVMLADEFPEWGEFDPNSLKGSPVTLHLYVENVDNFVKRAVKAGAKVTMPVADTFWGDRYGKLEDPFGHKWSVATHIRDVSPKEIKRAAKEMFSQK
jgi:uncharacterized glyoxalase superfamily protein PhnB